MNAHAIPFPIVTVAPACEVTTLASLSREPAAWDALVARADGPTPDYARRVLEAHRDHGLAPEDLPCLAVRAGSDLLALLPFRIGRGPLGLGWIARPFASPYLTVTAPLVVAGPEGAPALAALVAGMRGLGHPWWWPLLPAEGSALRPALARDGWGTAEVAGFLRPVLDRRMSHDAFLREHPHKGRLKDLRRRRRRLDEAGAVTVEAVGPDGDLAGAVAEFLALERRGWKGRAGTALACRRQTENFAKTLFRAGDGSVTARADLCASTGGSSPRAWRWSAAAPPPCSRPPTTKTCARSPPACCWKPRSSGPCTRRASPTGSIRRPWRARCSTTCIPSASASPRSSSRHPAGPRRNASPIWPGGSTPRRTGSRRG